MLVLLLLGYRFAQLCCLVHTNVSGVEVQSGNHSAGICENGMHCINVIEYILII